MSAILRTKMFWSLALFVCLGVSLSQQAAAEAVTVPVFPTTGSTITADYKQNVTVTVSGVGTTTNVTLSLVDSVGPAHTPTGTVISDDTLTISNVGNGPVTFHNVQVTTPSATGKFFLLQVKTTTSTAVQSALPFTVTAGVPALLTFSAEPDHTVATFAGAVIQKNGGGDVLVKLTDAENNPLGGQTVVMQSSGPNLTGTLSHTTSNLGVADFGDLRINAANTGISLIASSNGLSVVSTTFDVIASSVNTVTISAGPTPSTVSADNNFALSVTASDTFGNPVTGTVALALYQSNGTTLETTALLSDTSVPVTPPSKAATGGTTDFNSLNINLLGTYKIKATVTTTVSGTVAVTSSASSAVTITPGVPSAITINTQPGSSNIPADNTFTVNVTVRDAETNLVADGTSVTLSSSPSVSITGGTATTTGGIANFTARITTVGGPYTLTVHSGAASQALTPFSVIAGAAAAITFSQQPPSSTAAGALFATAPQVTVKDAFGNLISGSSVALTLLPSGTLTATAGNSTTEPTSSGVATFNGLSVTPAGTYQLKATAGGINVNSDIFTITAGLATKLVFSQPPPTSIPAGTPFNVIVKAEDGAGSVDATYNHSLVLQITKPTGATVIVSPASPALAGGTATFSLTPDLLGSYTVTATAGALTPTPAAPFTVTPGAPHTLIFTTQPVSTSAGANIPVVVHVTDGSGNPVPNITVTVSPTLGAINGTNTVLTDSNGDATYTDLNITRAVSNIKLSATTSGVAAVLSNPFNITAGGVSTLTFTQQPPSSVPTGQAFSPVAVVAKDLNGNVVAGITISLALNGAPTAGGTATLTPLPPLSALTNSSGIAIFTGLSVDKVGSAYTLTASTPDPASTTTPPASITATSNTFAITAGNVHALSFSTQPPTNVNATLPFSVVVHATDAPGNAAVGVSVTLVLNQAAGGTAILTPVSPVATTDANGNATFSGLSVDKVGAYTLTASTPDPASTTTPPASITATSNTFNIIVGAPNTLVFSTQPSGAQAGGLFGTVATLTDTGGNPVAGVRVTLALNQNNGAALAPSSPSVVTDANGNATFSNLQVNLTGTYTLTASVPAATGVSSVTSNQFTITAGTPLLSFAVGPTATLASGSGLPITVHLQDTSGNPFTGATVSLQLLIGTTAAAFTSTSTTTTTTGNDGNAVFSNLSIGPAGTGYTIVASAVITPAPPAQPSPIVSSSFTVTPGVPAAVTFTAQPSSVAPGLAITPAVTVQVADAAGNLIPNAPVILSLATTGALTGQGTLSNGPTGLTVNTGSSGSSLGVAQFSNLTITLPGTYQLVATVSPVSGTSSIFTIGNLPPTITVLTITRLLDGTTGQTAATGPVHAGDTSVTLAITGQNFAPGSTVSFGGVLLTSGVTYDSVNLITVALPDTLLTQAGTEAVIVNNPSGLPNAAPLASAAFNLPVCPLGPTKTSNRTVHTPDSNGSTQYFDPGLQLFSVPFDYGTDTIKSDLQVFQLTPSPNDPTNLADLGIDSVLAVWNPVSSAYDLTPNGAASKLALGQGYWGRFRFLAASTTEGFETGLKTHGVEAAVLNNLFTISLSSGWNMIGDPFIGSVPLNSIQVQALDSNLKATGQPVVLVQANGAGIVSDYLYKYVSGTPTAAGTYSLVVPSGLLQPNGSPVSGDNYLNPYIGYWVFAYQPCQLLIPSSLQVLE